MIYGVEIVQGKAPNVFGVSHFNDKRLGTSKELHVFFFLLISGTLRTLIDQKMISSYTQSTLSMLSTLVRLSTLLDITE